MKNKNVEAISSGVDEENFANPNGKGIRDKYGIKEDEILLLLVSRLTKEKNVEFVFHSLKNILKKEKVKFLIVSDGYLMPKLKGFCERENISEKVIFCGDVKREEIKNYFVASDIFVYGSKSETQGMIITEAMYAGLPIVAVNATGINSLVLNNGNGFLVEENKQEFEKAVLKLINDKDLRKKFSETSSRIAKMNFTASVCAEKMMEVYEKCLNH